MNKNRKIRNWSLNFHDGYICNTPMFWPSRVQNMSAPAHVLGIATNSLRVVHWVDVYSCKKNDLPDKCRRSAQLIALQQHLAALATKNVRVVLALRKPHCFEKLLSSSIAVGVLEWQKVAQLDSLCESITLEHNSRMFRLARKAFVCSHWIVAEHTH